MSTNAALKDAQLFKQCDKLYRVQLSEQDRSIFPSADELEDQMKLELGRKMHFRIYYRKLRATSGFLMRC